MQKSDLTGKRCIMLLQLMTRRSELVVKVKYVKKKTSFYKLSAKGKANCAVQHMLCKVLCDSFACPSFHTVTFTPPQESSTG